MNEHVIKITPALLLDTVEGLNTMLQIYSEIGFKAIDIDIQETPFASDDTVSFQTAFDLVNKLDLINKTDIGWDLKLARPAQAVQTLIAANPNFRIYVYEDADLSFLAELPNREQLHIGLGIKGESSIDPQFDYAQYAEIQIMAIDEEEQGGSIDVKLLEKISKLREVGYTGKISIDGGVNMHTAHVIKQYSPDRVSVGSYFQASEGDIQAAYDELDKALNG